MITTRKISSKILILFLLVTYYGCNKDIEEDDIIEGEIITPTEIQAIEPTQGRAATEVTITGTNFGTNINNVQVFFNGIEAEITAITNTSITTTVPRSIETGAIRIIINGTEILGPEFTYILTPAQIVTITGQNVIGDAIGSLSESSFNRPLGIVKDANGIIYITDFRNHKIKTIDVNTGMVNVLAGDTLGNVNGTGEEAMFNFPRVISFDTSGDIIVSDQNNQQIKRVTTDGVVSTVAGSGVAGFDNGTSTMATFQTPIGVIVDQSNTIYVADFSNHSIRKISPQGEVTTVAGNGEAGDVNGVGIAAQFNNPVDIDIDASGNLYVTDWGNHKIKKIATDGTVTVLAGSGIVGDLDGTVNEARFNGPQGVLVDNNGIVYIADTNNHKIKKINPDGTVITIAGTGESGNEDGDALNAIFAAPIGMLLDESTNELYITVSAGIIKYIPEF